MASDLRSKKANQPVSTATIELEVADFGPIVEAKIDLRPLTVFVGPSNMGKSYLAILLYALHRYFSDNGHFSDPRYRGRRWMMHPAQTDNLLHSFIEVFSPIAQSQTERPEIFHEREMVLSTAITDAIRSNHDNNSSLLVSEIRRCFGIENPRTLVRKGNKNCALVKLRRSVPSSSAEFEYTLKLGANSESTMEISDNFPIFLSGQETHEINELYQVIQLDKQQRNKVADEEFFVRQLMKTVNNIFFREAIGPLHSAAYYLPADRTGVMHAHGVVVSALIANAPTAGLRSTARTAVLSGVLADFLEQLIEIDRYPRVRRKQVHDYGARIETEMLKGEVYVERPGAVDYPRFAYRPEGWKDKLALANASSMVSELAPIVLYLRHIVLPDNVLIVEEPESHLHPAMQVAFMRELAVLVKAGIRVVITTHSEWLLEELTNIVRRSELPDAKQDDVALRPDQVGAWLFEHRRRPKGAVVKEMEIDNSGLYPSGYESVAVALHNEWAGLTSAIEAGS